MMTHRALAIAVAPLLVPLMIARTGAFAQTTAPNALATAQTLNDQAQEAMAKKDYATACPLLEAVVELIPDGMGAQLSLAECYEGAGKLASALTAYAYVDEVATKPSQAQYRRTAHKRAEMLKPQVPKLKIVVAEAVRGIPGLEITRDELAVGSAQWGISIPMDKGNHTIVATGTGKQRWERSIQITNEGATESVVVVDGIVDLKSAEPAVAPPPAPLLPVVKPTPSPPLSTSTPDKPWGAQKIAALAVGGAGLAGIGVGVGFGSIALARKKESGPHCTGGGNWCDLTGKNLRQESVSAASVSTVTFLVGGAVLAAGFALYITSPRSSVSTSTKVSAGLDGIAVSGAW